MLSYRALVGRFSFPWRARPRRDRANRLASNDSTRSKTKRRNEYIYRNVCEGRASSHADSSSPPSAFAAASASAAALASAAAAAGRRARVLGGALGAKRVHLNLVTRLTLALGDETRLKTRLFTDETAQVEQLGATNLVDWKKKETRASVDGSRERGPAARRPRRRNSRPSPRTNDTTDARDE